MKQFGILWNKIEGSIKRVTKIVTCCVKLHNFILDTNQQDVDANPFCPDQARHFDGKSFDVYMMINGIVIGVGLYARAIPYTSPQLLPRK